MGAYFAVGGPTKTEPTAPHAEESEEAASFEGPQFRVRLAAGAEAGLAESLRTSCERLAGARRRRRRTMRWANCVRVAAEVFGDAVASTVVQQTARVLFADRETIPTERLLM